jgi:hypothetical protein
MNYSKEDAVRTRVFRERLQAQGYYLSDTLDDCGCVAAFLSASYLRDADAASQLSYAACSLRKPYVLVSLEALPAEFPAGLAMLAARHGVAPAENMEAALAARLNAPPATWTEIPAEKRYAYKPFEADEADFAFISYAHDDSHLVYPLIKSLYEQGWNQWYDEGIRISERYLTSIAVHIRDCSAFLLFVTEKSINRPFVVEFELAYALHLHKPVIPVLVEQPASNLPASIADLSLILPDQLDTQLTALGLPNFGTRTAVPPKDRKGEEYDLTGLTPLPGFEFEIVDDTIKLTKYTGNRALVEIPNSHCGLPVTSIERDAFSKCESLVSITLPGSVTRIDSFAFSYCSALTGITLPEGVTSLGEWAFTFCSALERISFPGSLATIPRDCCSHCISLTEVMFAEGVAEIDDLAFAECESLRRIALPQGVVRVGWMAFRGCKSLQGVALPDSVSNMSSGTFKDCESLKGIRIPRGVDTIGQGMFERCAALTDVSIPDSVTFIGDEAFKDCTKLKDVSIPDSVACMGRGAFRNTLWRRRQPSGPVYVGRTLYAFEGEAPAHFSPRAGTLGISGGALSVHNELVRVSIPDGVTRIGNKAFAWSNSLQSIDIPDSVAVIDREAFKECSALTEIHIPRAVTRIDEGTFAWCESLAELIIPQSVTHIGDKAFCGCTSLIEITIPGSVISMGSKVFYKCSQLQTVCCFENSAAHRAAREQRIAVRFIGVQAEECLQEPEQAEEAAPVPALVPDIPYALLCNAESDEAVGERVRELREYGYVIKSAQDASLFDCGMILAFITQALLHDENALGLLREAVATDKPLATAYIDSLPDDLPLDLRMSVGQIEGAFSSDLEFGNRLRSTLQSYGCYQNSFQDFQYTVQGDEITLTNYNGRLRELYVPRRYPDTSKTVTRIEKLAFRGCHSLIEVILPDSVSSIDDYVFVDCASLTDVAIPDSVTRIGAGAFSKCVSLTSITIPASVTDVAASAFSGCTSLSEITVADGNTCYVGQEGALFNRDRSAILCLPAGYTGHYVIPEGVTKICKNAFSGCAALTGVSIPNSVTRIEKGAFACCASLARIEIPDSVTRLESEFFEPAFTTCSALTEVRLGRGITRIEESAFMNCSALAEIVIPDSVTCIEKWAFHSCSSLAAVTIPESVTKIMAQVFLNACPALTIYTPPGSYAAQWARRESLEPDGYDENGTPEYKARWAKLYGIACEPIPTQASTRH